MRHIPRTPRWLPFVTFLAGILVTTSMAVFLDGARGQVRSGNEQDPPSSPPDLRLTQEIPDDRKPDEAPEAEDDWTVDEGEGGIEAVYNAFFHRICPAPQELGDLPDRKQLARQRYELAGEALESALLAFAGPPRRGGPDLGERLAPVVEWSRHRLAAHLDMAGSDEEQASVLRTEIAHARAILSIREDLSRGVGSVNPTAFSRLDLYRLELESRLAELTRE
jgi:hypothetical protein